jgi:hypothetical protein
MSLSLRSAAVAWLLGTAACGDLGSLPHSTGGGDVIVHLNSAPLVTAMRATPSYVGAGEATVLQVNVRDEESRVLLFEWRDPGGDCAGSVSDSTAASTIWTAPSERPRAGECAILLRAFDGDGGTGEGILMLALSLPPPPTDATWTQSVTTYQSTASAPSGGEVVFRVTVEEPPDAPLTFIWSGDCGAGAQKVAPASSELTLAMPSTISTCEVRAEVRAETVAIEQIFFVARI